MDTPLRPIGSSSLNVRWWALALWLVVPAVLLYLVGLTASRGSQVPALVWSGVCLVGVTLSVVSVLRVMEDSRRVTGNGAAQVYLGAFIRREIVRTTALVSMFVAGVTALLHGPGWLVVASLMYAPWAITVNLAWDYTLRDRMRQAEDRDVGGRRT